MGEANYVYVDVEVLKKEVFSDEENENDRDVWDNKFSQASENNKFKVQPDDLPFTEEQNFSVDIYGLDSCTEYYFRIRGYGEVNRKDSEYLI